MCKISIFLEKTIDGNKKSKEPKKRPCEIKSRKGFDFNRSGGEEYENDRKMRTE